MLRRVRRKKNWRNIFSIRKQRGKTLYTLSERKIISGLFAIIHIHCNQFSTMSSIVIICILQVMHAWL